MRVNKLIKKLNAEKKQQVSQFIRTFSVFCVVTAKPSTDKSKNIFSKESIQLHRFISFSGFLWYIIFFLPPRMEMTIIIIISLPFRIIFSLVLFMRICDRFNRIAHLYAFIMSVKFVRIFFSLVMQKLDLIFLPFPLCLANEKHFFFSRI